MTHRTGDDATDDLENAARPWQVGVHEVPADECFYGITAHPSTIVVKAPPVNGGSPDELRSTIAFVAALDTDAEGKASVTVHLSPEGARTFCERVLAMLNVD